MSLSEALERMPAKVSNMFAELREAPGEAAQSAKLLEQLNAVYGRAQSQHDALGPACRERRVEAQREVQDARDGLTEVELQLTQLQDRAQSLQAGMDRSLAEVEALRGQFEEHRGLCSQSEARRRSTLALLSKDLPLARGLVANVTAECSDAPPELVECTLPDDSFLTTFKDAGRRSLVSRLSGPAERLLSLHLDHAVRRDAVVTSLLEKRGVLRRWPRGNQAATAPRSRHGTRHVAATVAVRLVHDRPRRLRSFLQRKNISMHLCSDAKPPRCEALADNLETFAGNVEDLIDELKLQEESEGERCRQSLQSYEREIAGLRRRSEDAAVSLARVAAERGSLASSRMERRSEVADVVREADLAVEECGRQLEDAASTMCGARKLHQELGSAATGAFLGACEVTDWTAEPCSQPCGHGGMQNLTREIILAPKVSALCPNLETQRACNVKPCPVDGQMGRWHEWSECSRACGGGTRTRHRTIVREAEHGGLPTGETMQEELCNAEPCDQDCALSQWTEWSTCSKACRSGHRVRRRSVLRSAFGEGSCAAPDDKERRQTAACNRRTCKAAFGDVPPICASALDVVLALDTSGSVGAAGLTSTKAFVQALLARSGLGDTSGVRTGLISFGSNATVAQAPTAELQSLLTSLAAVPSKGTTTGTGAALAVAGGLVERHGREGVPRVVVVITDGMPQSSHIMNTEVERLNSRGIRVALVAVGPGLAERALKRWASWPAEENLVLVDSYAALDEVKVTELLANLCPTLAI
mmetsp:Transcript_7669/g.17538  ORF Transcript_7669/g.17538 Transcript_7669/m.17538 type:complete len:761 (-) Transcript_7669:50-2332(-)